MECHFKLKFLEDMNIYLMRYNAEFEDVLGTAVMISFWLLNIHLFQWHYALSFNEIHVDKIQTDLVINKKGLQKS